MVPVPTCGAEHCQGTTAIDRSFCFFAEAVGHGYPHYCIPRAFPSPALVIAALAARTL